MYILSVIVVIVSVFLLASAGEAGVFGIFHFFDIVSMLIVIIIFISMMVASGLLKDFNNAFRLTIGKKNAKSILELNSLVNLCIIKWKRAKEAVKFAGKLFIMSGFLGTLMGIIMVGYSCSTIKSIMINMSVALLTMFYGLVLYILLLPIQLRIEIKISEFMQI